MDGHKYIYLLLNNKVIFFFPTHYRLSMIIGCEGCYFIQEANIYLAVQMTKLLEYGTTNKWCAEILLAYEHFATTLGKLYFYVNCFISCALQLSGN